MARRPTIADVAKEAGVSRTAVSFALNGRPGLSAETTERILRAARQLGWQPNRAAQGLSQGRAFAVGLVLTRPAELLGEDPFFPAFIAGVESVLAVRKDGLMLHVTTAEDEADTYRRLAAERRVDGVLLTDLRVDDPRPDFLAEQGLPAVALGAGKALRDRMPCVDLDDRQAITAAVRHLVELGHRRIAHVAGPQQFLHARRRQAAWEEALRDAGLEPGPVLAGGFSAQGGAEATRELLSLADRPTAIVFANDLSAIAGLAVAQQLGVRVPEDLSITGYDDTSLAVYTHPPLTTARADAARWGRAAAECLETLIDTGAADHVDLPPAELVVRGSTGPAPEPATH